MGITLSSAKIRDGILQAWLVTKKLPVSPPFYAAFLLPPIPLGDISPTYPNSVLNGGSGHLERLAP